MNLNKILILYYCLLVHNSYADEYLIPANPTVLPTITADKTKGIITVYWPDSGKELSTPALFGKVKSNTLNMDNYDYPNKFDNITPAGTFTVTKMVSWRLNENMLVFIKGKNSYAAIHPVWNGNPDQNRMKRLQSTTPDDNRITGGCINVDPVFYYSVLDYLPDGTTLTILPE
jgi:hypothetical protein